MEQKLDLIRQSYEMLLKVLNEQRDTDLQYIIQQIETSIHLINDFYMNPKSANELETVMIELSRIYKMK
ncbi:hypothetical protein CU633_12605 [Bacillus sp. V3-13]|nr:hypothetical protein CU633_12605 [Bacillus sp. V3-13]